MPAGESLPALGRPRGQPGAVFERGAARPGQRELLQGGYGEETPAAVVYKVSWPEEQIARCTVGTLAQTMRQMGQTGTAAGAGGRLSHRPGGRSCLYDPGFATAFRPGEGEKGEGGEMTIATIAFTPPGLQLGRRLGAALGPGWELTAGFGPGGCGSAGVDGGAVWRIRRACVHRRGGHRRAGRGARTAEGQGHRPGGGGAWIEGGRFVIPLVSDHLGGAGVAGAAASRP